MPLIHVTSNLTLTDAEKSNALKTLSQAVAELLDKPEKIVMTSWTTAKMTMAGTDAPTAFVELRAIRLPEDAPGKLSKELCERLSLTVDIRADRIFLNFSDIEPGKWGWDGKTFG
jgi:phenylpyruvate tautomerase